MSQTYQSPRFDAVIDSWLLQVFRQLQAIEELPDGWDSRGGKAPDSKIVQRACSLIAALSTSDPALPQPHVHPTPSGGVQFHWEAGPRYFELELVDPTLVQYYFHDRNAQVETEGQVRAGESLDEALDLARRASA